MPGNYNIQFTIPAGATGPANGLNSYGGVYSTTQQTLNTPTAAVTVTMNSTMPSSNLNAAAGNVNIVNTGVYEINYYAVLSAVEAGTYTLLVDNSGVTVEGTSQTIDVAADGTVNVSGSIIVDLTSGAVLSLRVSSADITNGSVDAAALSAKQLNANA